MKKIALFLFALVLMSNSECNEHTTFESDIQTYKVLEKGNHVASHFNPLHNDWFEVGTDYFITLQNTSKGFTFVHKCSGGNEYYQYQVGKKYKVSRFHEDWKRK